MSIKNRLTLLERTNQNNKSLMPGLVLFVDGNPTPEQQKQIDEAEAIGQTVIIFDVVDARVNPT